MFLSIIFNSIYTLLNTNYFIRFPIFHSFVDILYRKNVNVCPVEIIVFLKTLFHACLKSSKKLCTDGSQGIHFSGFLILYMNHNYHILFLPPSITSKFVLIFFNSKLYLLFYRRNVTLDAVEILQYCNITTFFFSLVCPLCIVISDLIRWLQHFIFNDKYIVQHRAVKITLISLRSH